MDTLTTPPNYPEPNTEKNQNRKWQIFLAINLVVLIIAVASWFLVFKNQISENKKNTQEISTTTPVESITMTDWKTFENKDFAYTFKYPPNWSKDGLNTIVSQDRKAQFNVAKKTCDSYNSDGNFKESIQSTTTNTSIFYKDVCYVGLSVRLAIYGNQENLDGYKATLEQILDTMQLNVDDSLWQIYENKNFLFKFKYPKEFKLKINENYSQISIYVGETNFYISASKTDLTTESIKKLSQGSQSFQFQGREALLMEIGDCDKEIVFVKKGIKYQIMEPNSCGAPLDRRMAKIFETFQAIDLEIEAQTEVFNGLNYRDEQYGFEFKYPYEWTLKRGPITYNINPDTIVVRYTPKNNASKPKCEEDDGLFLCTSTKIVNAGNINAYIFLDKGQAFGPRRLLERPRDYFQDYVDILDKNGNKITIEFFSIAEKEESLKTIEAVLSTFKFTK